MWMKDDDWWIEVWSISVVKRCNWSKNFSWCWVGASEAHDSRTDGHPHLTLLRASAHPLAHLWKMATVKSLIMWLGWGKPEFGVVDPHNSQMCTLFRCSPFLRGVERRAPEHHSTPQEVSKIITLTTLTTLTELMPLPRIMCIMCIKCIMHQQWPITPKLKKPANKQKKAHAQFFSFFFFYLHYDALLDFFFLLFALLGLTELTKLT